MQVNGIGAYPCQYSITLYFLFDQKLTQQDMLLKHGTVRYVHDVGAAKLWRFSMHQDILLPCAHFYTIKLTSDRTSKW